jgi:hypothetical protein
MMDLSENFLKLIQLAIIVVGCLAIFFTYINYNITVETSSSGREAVVFGYSMLSSECLTYSNTQSLFEENKLASMQADSSCLKKVYPYGYIEVNLQDMSEKWQIEIGGLGTSAETTYNVAVRLDSGEVKPAFMVVKI